MLFVFDPCLHLCCLVLMLFVVFLLLLLLGFLLMLIDGFAVLLFWIGLVCLCIVLLLLLFVVLPRFDCFVWCCYVLGCLAYSVLNFCCWLCVDVC